MRRRSAARSPLDAYDLASRQKRQLGERFRHRILRLHRTLRKAGGPSTPPSSLPAAMRPRWRDACRDFVDAGASDPASIAAAYRATVMRHGVKRVDPAARRFGHDLREFHRHYVANFPLPEEQETLAGFRELWRPGTAEGGYQELGYSVLCPLTGHYVIGLNFTVQPRSDSVHFIYGFVSPAARVIGGFSECLLTLMRRVAGELIAAHLERHPADRPPFHDPAGPLILFEKNIVERMTLTDILMDTAGIDIDRPPQAGQRLTASGISQSLRDLVWDRRGGRVVDYGYIQSSLDGVVRVPEPDRSAVIAYLNGTAASGTQPVAESALEAALGNRLPGCTALELCCFAPHGTLDLAAEQIRRSNQIFQGISVVKDAAALGEDIYYQAQMASLASNSPAGRIVLRPITPAGSGVRDFMEAEALTRRLLGGLTWERLRAGRDRSYREWLDEVA